jgi:hypothetical protein
MCLFWGCVLEFPRRNDNRSVVILCVFDYEESVTTEYITGSVDSQKCYVAVCSGCVLVFFAV